MDSLFLAGRNAAQLTPEQVMEEFISQKLNRWRAKQEKVPDRELAAQIVAMCWDFGSLPRQGPGCLLPDHKGGYVYVPYDDSREGLGPELEGRVEKLEKWFRDPANAPVLRRLDKVLEEEVDEKCWWEFLDGGSAARVDFHGKIKMLAKYRLMQRGVDVSPNDPVHPQFKFGVTDVTEFGAVRMEWRHLNWSCTENDVVRSVNDFPRSLFTLESVLARQLRELETIHHPEDAAQEAQTLANELKSRQPVTAEPEWFYFLCNAREGVIPLEKRTWTPLRKQPNDIKMMKRLSREQGRWPIITRPWQLRHHNVCFQISTLQRRQLEYCQKCETASAAALEAAAQDKDNSTNAEEGEPCLDNNEA